MSKDSDDCEIMNELFNGDELPKYHWFPVAEYDQDDNKIRDYTREEQIKWIQQQKELNK